MSLIVNIYCLCEMSWAAVQLNWSWKLCTDLLFIFQLPTAIRAKCVSWTVYSKLSMSCRVSCVRELGRGERHEGGGLSQEIPRICPWLSFQLPLISSALICSFANKAFVTVRAQEKKLASHVFRDFPRFSEISVSSRASRGHSLPVLIIEALPSIIQGIISIRNMILIDIITGMNHQWKLSTYFMFYNI